MFPNNGQRVVLRTYSRIYNHDGSLFFDNTPTYIPAISDVSAYWMTSMLHDAVVSGTGGSANLGSRMPTAGKTGTSTDNRDRWFVGYTPYYLAAVWTGFDKPAHMTSSGNPAAQIWKMVMEPIHEELESRAFSIPAYTELEPIEYSIGMETSDYTVQCVDTYGVVMMSTTTRAVVGTEITEDAPEIPGFRVIGQSFGAVEVTADPARNVITFIYDLIVETDPDEPPATEEPPETEPADNNPPDTEPPDTEPQETEPPETEPQGTDPP
jgi:penicillin-binding protein 1A